MSYDRKKSIGFFILLLLAVRHPSAAVSAEAYDFGARGGLCRSMLWGPDASGTEQRDAFSGSLFLAYPLGRRISLQPELAYSMRGWIVEGETGTFTARPTYVEASVLARITLPVESDIGWHALAGLYTAYAITAGGGFVDREGVETERDIADFRRFDAGLAIGGDIVVKPVRPHIVIGVRYFLGMIDLLEFERARTQALVLSIGISFTREAE